ncbi:MAG: hypothetical protein OEM39_04665 [Acidimicrobiia bacterium]|nr:hypothetical protein [Acidimicrobiia bacterium]
MKKRTKALLIGAVFAGAAALPAIAQAGGAPNSEASEIDVPITGPNLDKATSAALDYLGEGRVTGTEIEDEESYYEVEVTLDNGRQVDVQLDEQFNIVGSEQDGTGADD